MTLLAVPVSGCGSKGALEADRADGVLHLGASLSLTGDLAREGQLTRNGYELCEQVVNEEGGVPVGGKRMTLDIELADDTSRPDVAAQIVDRFHDQGVQFILGPYGSAATEAAAAVVERNGQVMVDSLGADDRIFDRGYRRTFAVLSPASTYASAILEALHELADPAPRSVVFLSADDGFSRSVTAGGLETARRLGLEVLATEYFPHGSAKVSTVLTKVRPLHPDVIIGSTHFAEGVAIVKQSKELDVRPLVFGETVAPATPDFAHALGPLAEGILGSSQWVATAGGKDSWFGSAEDYARAYRRAFDTEAHYHSASASAACLALVLAIDQADTIDANAVRDRLADLDVDTFFGPIDFDGTGKNVRKPMYVVQIQNGEPVPVWPRDVATSELAWPEAR